MDYKEAIKHLGEICQIFNLEYDQYLAVKKGMEACRMQTPGEPTEVIESYDSYAAEFVQNGKCPSCKHTVAREFNGGTTNFCNHCGLPMDWSNVAWLLD